MNIDLIDWETFLESLKAPLAKEQSNKKLGPFTSSLLLIPSYLFPQLISLKKGENVLENCANLQYYDHVEFQQAEFSLKLARHIGGTQEFV